MFGFSISSMISEFYLYRVIKENLTPEELCSWHKVGKLHNPCESGKGTSGGMAENDKPA